MSFHHQTATVGSSSEISNGLWLMMISNINTFSSEEVLRCSRRYFYQRQRRLKETVFTDYMSLCFIILHVTGDSTKELIKETEQRQIRIEPWVICQGRENMFSLFCQTEMRVRSQWTRRTNTHTHTHTQCTHIYFGLMVKIRKSCSIQPANWVSITVSPFLRAYESIFFSCHSHHTNQIK